MKMNENRTEHKRPGTPGYGGRIGYGIFHAVIRIAGPIPAYFLLALILPYYALIRKSAIRSTYPYLDRGPRAPFPSALQESKSRRRSRTPRLRRFFRAVYYMFQFGKVLIDQAAMGILGKERFSVDFPGGRKFYGLASGAEGKGPVAHGRGMVLITTHAGNWMTAMAVMEHVGRPVNLLFDTENLDGRHFFDLSGERDRFRFISPKGFMGGLIEATDALRAGEIVAIMGDRPFGAKTLKTKFLGKEAAFPITPYHLAYMTGADVVVFLTARTGRLAFSIEAECISEGLDISRMGRAEAFELLLGRYVSALENYLARHPYMWFNFYDFWGAHPADETEKAASANRTNLQEA